MENLLNRIIKLFIVIAIIILCIALTVLFDDLKFSSNITQTDTLSGQRIGVMSGWESDYFLSDREDINLKRYDTTAELFMALNYKQIDAVAIDQGTFMLAKGSISGIKSVGNPLAKTEYTIYTSKANTKLLNELNTFIEYFKNSDEYELFCERFYDLDWICSEELTEQSGNGAEIKIGYVIDYYPFEYVNEEGKPCGNEVELAIQFANYYNYTIKWVECEATTVYTDIESEKVDFAVCCGTDAYREETLNENSLLSMSIGYIDSNIYCVVPDGKMDVFNEDFYNE